MQTYGTDSHDSKDNDPCMIVPRFVRQINKILCTPCYYSFIFKNWHAHKIHSKHMRIYVHIHRAHMIMYHLHSLQIHLYSINERHDRRNQKKKNITKFADQAMLFHVQKTKTAKKKRGDIRISFFHTTKMTTTKNHHILHIISRWNSIFLLMCSDIWQGGNVCMYT